ncbi:hypothetical protein LTLLF_188845 [Microtus ochrogaster]|uniref:Uncharacterized protein n=1 Tax=Microtus ochrogaster TaxID=79684 RepID=A0A8J6KN39_MICOH|nr:hypothetical protein LTLLF_188845 [Microtus ochrogaster]
MARQGRPNSDPRTPARPPFGDVPDRSPERRGQGPAGLGSPAAGTFRDLLGGILQNLLSSCCWDAAGSGFRLRESNRGPSSGPRNTL